MKKAQLILIITIAILSLLCFASCSKMDEALGDADGNGGMNGVPNSPGDIYCEPSFKYEPPIEGDVAPDAPTNDKPSGNVNKIIENPFVKVETMDTSTFSADVDTASYTFLRKMVNSGYSYKELKDIARANVIRTEEMVNYFNYSYASAPEGEMFGTKATIARSPWNEDTYLLMLGLKAKELETRTANNLVFLIDVSGSMNSADKLPLLKQAFSYLVDQLDENDTVSIVTYAGNERVVLEGTSGNKKEIILNAINDLSSGGSTNGEAGIVKAYEIAEANFKADGNNRIIIASDGDLNVGIRDPEQLEKLVEDKRKSGVFLSVLGFGSGNFRDDNMSAIAQTGNGVYHYIDTAAEAERIFATSLLSTIYTVAKDVKFQLKFDKNYVSEYRLIGYENRLLGNEDFDDDTKDAGEVGAGHTLTVCYELKLTDAALDTTDEESGTDNDEQANWIKLSIRYKEIDSEVSELREIDLGEGQLTDTPDEDFVFASTVIEFSMLIRDSAYNKADRSVGDLIEILQGLELDKEKTEFRDLLKKINK
jgi:Ca-activated chloride channel family protein